MNLRQVREADLDVLYAAHTAFSNRGAYFPLGVVSQPDFRGEFAGRGFATEAVQLLLAAADRPAALARISSRLIPD